MKRRKTIRAGRLVYDIAYTVPKPNATPQERKRILSDLASLVSQAKRASDETPTIPEETRDMETQGMVRLAGQLFAHVRGFLAVAVQCGVNLPAPAPVRPARSGSFYAKEI